MNTLPEPHRTIARLCQEFATHVMEHADAVQIFINFRDGTSDETHEANYGQGNTLSIRTQVEDWAARERAKAREITPKATP